jgi:hypothetical protein
MIAKLSESRPDSSNFKSSDIGTSVRCCSCATCVNTVVTVDLTDIPMYSSVGQLRMANLKIITDRALSRRRLPWTQPLRACMGSRPEMRSISLIGMGRSFILCLRCTQLPALSMIQR